MYTMLKWKNKKGLRVGVVDVVMASRRPKKLKGGSLFPLIPRPRVLTARQCLEVTAGSVEDLIKERTILNCRTVTVVKRVIRGVLAGTVQWLQEAAWGVLVRRGGAWSTAIAIEPTNRTMIVLSRAHQPTLPVRSRPDWGWPRLLLGWCTLVSSPS